MKLVILTMLFGFGVMQHNPNFQHGRTTIVQLFEWRWSDIAAECERFLAPKGFGGIQDNDPKHRLCKGYSTTKESDRALRQMTWPPQSPDLKPIKMVIDLGGEAISYSEYIHLGRVTEFKYGAKLGNIFRKWNEEKLFYTRTWGEGWGFMSDGNAVVFVDNHDNQRGHGAGGSSIITFWDSKLYKMAVGYMLAHPYGVARIMSSYRWNRNFVNGKDQNDWMGPPANTNGSTKSVPVNSDQTCGDGWVCEHRWRQITNMVIFRNVVKQQPQISWWDNQSNQVAFGRGDLGFIVFNNDDWDLDVTLNTGMSGGTYCDVISGQKDGNKCTGKQIIVSKDGNAHFKISNTDEDPFIAIHAESKL
ncbi:PREDICTED: pancreatic alpha-amylase-like [Cyprinodon variegatus]|uniref:pancreatic alpha-amylase-like n=1 Tax=Cyprinodon variegatus TaxID=28743 RepID=UPI0007426683|nr:PREDICTED: pancreatic alpha-amylase-like [Cyprinodon variegatus]